MWRAARDRVLVRRVDADDGAELVGLAALAWIAADTPAARLDLAEELGVDESSVSEAVSLLLASGWLTEVSR